MEEQTLKAVIAVSGVWAGSVAGAYRAHGAIDRFQIASSKLQIANCSGHHQVNLQSRSQCLQVKIPYMWMPPTYFAPGPLACVCRRVLRTSRGLTKTATVPPARENKVERVQYRCEAGAGAGKRACSTASYGIYYAWIIEMNSLQYRHRKSVNHSF